MTLTILSGAPLLDSWPLSYLYIQGSSGLNSYLLNFFSSYSIAVSCHKHHSNNYVSPIYFSCPNFLPQASHYISYYLFNILNKYFCVHISSLDLFIFCLQPGFPSNIMPKALNKFKPQTKMVFFIPLFCNTTINILSTNTPSYSQPTTLLWITAITLESKIPYLSSYNS